MNRKLISCLYFQRHEDLCQASQTIRNDQFPKLIQARYDGKIAFLQHTRLIIKERTGQLSSSARGASRVTAVGNAFGVGVTTVDETSHFERGAAAES